MPLNRNSSTKFPNPSFLLVILITISIEVLQLDFRPNIIFSFLDLLPEPNSRFPSACRLCVSPFRRWTQFQFAGEPKSCCGTPNSSLIFEFRITRLPETPLPVTWFIIAHPVLYLLELIVWFAGVLLPYWLVNFLLLYQYLSLIALGGYW